MRVSFSGDKGLNASVRFFLCTLKMLWNFFVFYSKFPTFVFFFFVIVEREQYTAAPSTRMCAV